MIKPISLKSTVLAGALAALPLAALAALPALPALAQAPVQLQSFAPLVEAAKPAVVTVVTETAIARTGGGDMPDGMEEFFERFFPDGWSPFGQVPRREAPRQGLGSGFIIAEDGVIVTNNHVVEGAGEIRVILDDGRSFDAELVGRDDRVDLAVLRIEAEDLPTVEWGLSDEVRVGDWVLAIGNPLGLDGTVTMGIVSARGRDINSGPYDDYLQVDAAINRGNSGGPLFDLNGTVIGVNTAILSPSGGNVGLGFAIPAAQAQEIVADLLDDGRVERGWIGVSIQPVTDDIAESLALDPARGALVAEVVADSPAEAAGLRPGDIVLGFKETEVEEVRDLTRAVAASDIGAEAEIEVWRDGERQVLTISPTLLAAANAPAAAAPDGLPELGLALADGDGGVAVTGTEPGLPAAEAGLRPGDLILSVNQTVVTAPADLRRALEDAVERDRPSLLVLIDREGARRFLTVDLPTA